jgi:type II secretory pathway pseudopilin PulG
MSRQSGFSLLSLLMVAAVLLAGLSFALIGSGSSVSGQLSTQRASQLVAQAQFIVHRITKCAADYPNGDNGMAIHKAYPADTTTSPALGPPLPIKYLVCPGNNQNLWSGVDGVYAPAPLAQFGEWTYTNANPAIVSITGTAPNSAALERAATQIGPAASATADTLTVKVIE